MVCCTIKLYNIVFLDNVPYGPPPPPPPKKKKQLKNDINDNKTKTCTQPTYEMMMIKIIMITMIIVVIIIITTITIITLIIIICPDITDSLACMLVSILILDLVNNVLCYSHHDLFLQILYWIWPIRYGSLHLPKVLLVFLL